MSEGIKVGQNEMERKTKKLLMKVGKKCKSVRVGRNSVKKLLKLWLAE